MHDGGHHRSLCPQVEPDKRAAVLSCDAPLLQPVHSQYTKRPLSALNHRYPSRTLLEQYQRSTRLSTTTSDPDNDLIIRRSSVQVRPAPLVFPQVTGLRSDTRLWRSSLGSRLWHICGTFVAHLWHIRNLNPPVVVRAGPAPLTSAQVKRPGSRHGPLGGKCMWHICGTCPSGIDRTQGR